jgi:hypothetical protein
MSGRRRVTTVIVGAAWAVCLLGLGCEAEVSYRFVNPFTSRPTELADADEEDGQKVKAAEWAAKPSPDTVKQAAAQEQVPAPVQRVSADEDGGPAAAAWHLIHKE